MSKGSEINLRAVIVRQEGAIGIANFLVDFYSASGLLAEADKVASTAILRRVKFAF